MRKLILFTLLSLIMLDVYSQRRRVRYKYEIIYSLGMTNFLGEVGGANRVGTNFARDLEWRAIRPVAGIGLRYKTSPYYGFKVTLNVAQVTGRDSWTEEMFRNNRNITFRSSIIELGGHIEGYFTKENTASIYRIRNVKGRKKKNIQAYGFTGIHGFYFNPKGKYQNSWVALQPLGTEGQGLNGTKKYSRFALAIPVGLGMKYKIDRRWSWGVEFGLRKTFTDYIDDVSTVYYDNAAILAAKGAPAAYLADPNKGVPELWSSTLAGEQRGDPKNKDSYMFLTFNVNYKFMYKRKTRSKF
ncbi:MAG: hypothetical protein J0M08_03795 [Bacteroidetes bacterium]|nr:hypothetical protein [Bacteroidota bacterium]